MSDRPLTDRLRRGPSGESRVIWWIVGALWAVSMTMAGAWGSRIDDRLASIDQTLTKSAERQGEVRATLQAHSDRIGRLEKHHP